MTLSTAKTVWCWWQMNDSVWHTCGMILTWEKQSTQILRDESVPALLCPPQIPHMVICDGTWDLQWGQRLTTGPWYRLRKHNTDNKPQNIRYSTTTTSKDVTQHEMKGRSMVFSIIKWAFIHTIFSKVFPHDGQTYATSSHVTVACGWSESMCMMPRQK